MLDYYLYSTHAGGHHLTNVFFHIANSMLLFLFLREATGFVWRSFFVAVFFAIHPLHVESVAWVSERKDVLSSFFFLISLISYVKYVRTKTFSTYCCTLLTFIMGLLSKPMVVTLPFILILLDIWPLNRIKPEELISYHKMRSILAEKIPFFILTIASCIITYLAQSEGAIMAFELLPLKARIFNSLTAYIIYIEKIFWPHNLAILYPHQGFTISIFSVVISSIIILLITFCIVKLSGKRPYLFTGWFWFFGMLIPVIGIIQVGAQAMADRYTYLPSIGIFVIFVWLASEYVNKVNAIITCIFVCLILSLLSIITWQQLDFWKTNGIFFNTHAS